MSKPEKRAAKKVTFKQLEAKRTDFYHLGSFIDYCHAVSIEARHNILMDSYLKFSLKQMMFWLDICLDNFDTFGCPEWEVFTYARDRFMEYFNDIHDFRTDHPDAFNQMFLLKHDKFWTLV